MPHSLVLPAKVYHLSLDFSLPHRCLWESGPSQSYHAHAYIKAVAILFSEFVYLVREHLHIPSHYSVKLYHNYKHLQMGTTVITKHRPGDRLLCGVLHQQVHYGYGYGIQTSLNEEDEPIDSTANLVVSLVGSGMQNLQVNLGMSMKEFETLLRSKFKLRDGSFLIIQSDDVRLCPTVCSWWQWKCTYPFSIPNSLFGARSFKHISWMRGDNH